MNPGVFLCLEFESQYYAALNLLNTELHKGAPGDEFDMNMEQFLLLSQKYLLVG